MIRDFEPAAVAISISTKSSDYIGAAAEQEQVTVPARLGGRYQRIVQLAPTIIALSSS
jgi:hypothetical protein